MKKLIFTTTLTVLSLVILAQSKAIYTNPEFKTLAKDHKTIAIVPFKATLSLRPKQLEKITTEELKEIEDDHGKSVQSALESYFLKKKNQYNFTVEFQGTNKTNAILAKNNITQDNIEKYTPEELTKLLEVDAVISGTLNTTKPMSEGASVALGLLVGFWGSTNSGRIGIDLYDGKTGELLWKYEKTLSRSLGSDIHTVINAMMRKASRKFPYITEE